MDGLDCGLKSKKKGGGEGGRGLHDEVTVALEVSVDAALETDDWAVGRLHCERLSDPKLGFFVDAALERAHG